MKTVFEGWNYVLEETADGLQPKRLGTGGFGSVFEIEKEGTIDFKSALKIISIPNQASVLKEYEAEGMSKEQILQILREEKDKAEEEIRLQISAKNNPNVVGIEDYMIKEKNNGIGWLLYIRMELLTPISEMAAGSLSQKEVRKLGIDICNALEECHNDGLLHRDIKPGNLFVDKRGHYKLGDFGISRVMKGTSGIVSATATEKYAAPEVITIKRQGPASDIYSLGLVMYELLNKGRLPFLPPADEVIRQSDREDALQKRLTGVKVPPINGVSDDLNNAVLYACAFDPDDRFSSAREMREYLESGIEKPVKKIQSDSGLRKTVSNAKGRKSKTVIISAIAIVVVGAVALMGVLHSNNNNAQENSAVKNAVNETTAATESSIAPAPQMSSELQAFPEYTGDTITVNSSEALLDALHNASDNTTIELESGEYNFNEPILIQAADIKIKGKGNTKPLINSQVIFMERGVMIEDVGIRLTSENQADEGNEGIRLEETGYLKNVDVQIEYSSENILRGVNAYAPVKMEGCNIDVDYGQNQNIAVEIGDDFSINNCVIKSNGLGIEFLSGAGKSVTDEMIAELKNNNTFEAETDISTYMDY